MQIIEFKDDDAAYMEWSRNHQDGLVLNVSNNFKEIMLHKPLCSHISTYDHRIDKDVGFTKNMKVCAMTVDELENWAGRNGDGISNRCQNCKP